MSPRTRHPVPSTFRVQDRGVPAGVDVPSCAVRGGVQSNQGVSLGLGYLGIGITNRDERQRDQ